MYRHALILTIAAMTALSASADATKECPMIRDTRNMRGSVTFVNTQKRVNVDGGLKKALDALDHEFHWDFRVTNLVETVVLSGAAATRKSLKTTVAVFFVDTSGLPVLTACPDEHFALVNVSSIADEGKASDRQIERRIRTETMRAFAFAFGAGFSHYRSILMSPAETLAEIDVIPANAFYPYDTLVSLRTVAESLGMGAYMDQYYEVACEEGWAPQPTNDVQKAIWDKVHAIPANPMKIEFDPKKGR